MKIKKDIDKILPKGCTRAVFGIYDNTLSEPTHTVVWRANYLAFAGKRYGSEDERLAKIPFAFKNYIEVDDIPLVVSNQRTDFQFLRIMALEMFGITFESEYFNDMEFDINDYFDGDHYTNEIREYILRNWEKLTNTPRVSQSSNLVCKITDDRVLNNIVGMYYNSQCGYYATLQKLVDYYQARQLGIHNLDVRINTLRNGYDAVKDGREIEWNGINFIIGGKK